MVKRIDELTASTSLAVTDLEIKEADPSGTKVHQYITALNKIKGYFKLNMWEKQASVSNPDAGYIRMFPDASGFINTQDESGNIRKLQPIRYIPISVYGPTTDVATGDGKAYFPVPPDLAGYNIVFCYAYNVTAGVTGTQTIQIHNLTDGVDVLSTRLTTDTAENGSNTAATAYVIDGTKDDLAAYDILRFDIDTIHTTAAKGLIIIIGVQYP